MNSRPDLYHRYPTNAHVTMLIYRYPVPYGMDRIKKTVGKKSQGFTYYHYKINRTHAVGVESERR